MNAITIWKMWHQVDETGWCSCGEPEADCFFYGLILPAYTRRRQQLYDDLFGGDQC